MFGLVKTLTAALLIAPLASLAAPVLHKRDVGVLTLTPIAEWQDKTIIARFPNEKDVETQLNGDVLQVGTDDTKYDFLSAQSNQGTGFMNLTTDDKTAYGHVVLHSDNNRALTVDYPGNAVGKTPYLSFSDISDDSAQMLQYFKLDRASGQLEFLGWGNRPYPGGNFGGPYAPAHVTNDQIGTNVTIASAKDSNGAFFLADH